MPKTPTVDARLARNRLLLTAAVLPVFIGLMALSTTASESLGFFEMVTGVVVGSGVVALVTRPVWWLVVPGFFGVRPRAVVLGTGRFTSGRATSGRIPRLRRTRATGWAVVPVAGAGVARWRIWTAYALPALVEVALAVAAWRVSPVPWGSAVALGMLAGCGILHIVTPGVSATPAWMLLRLPTADARALEQVTQDAAEERAQRAILVGDLAECRAVLAEASTTRPYTAALKCQLALAEGRYGDAAALAAEHGPSQPEYSVARALFAQYLVRARCYAREEQGPGSFPAAEDIEAAMAEGLSSVAATRSTDAQALYWLARGNTKRAAGSAAQARGVVVGPYAAAHLECTIALVETARNRPERAAKALVDARTLAPDLPRIAAVERWCVPGARPLGPHAVSEPTLE